jgi:hypothetical protein
LDLFRLSPRREAILPEWKSAYILIFYCKIVKSYYKDYALHIGVDKGAP